VRFIGGDIFRDSVNFDEPRVRLPGMSDVADIVKLLDRHWRNARTAASHNPLIYKECIVGD